MRRQQQQRMLRLNEYGLIITTEWKIHNFLYKQLPGNTAGSSFAVSTTFYLIEERRTGRKNEAGRQAGSSAAVELNDNIDNERLCDIRYVEDMSIYIEM